MPKHNFRQEQQKLIKLKRDALTAKKNKWTNPKVRSLAPLPEVHRSPGNLWAIIFGLLLVAGMGGLLFFTFQKQAPAADVRPAPTIWVQASPAEFQAVEGWLKSHLRPGSEWKLVRFEAEDTLWDAFLTGKTPALILLERSLAEVLYQSGVLSRYTGYSAISRPALDYTYFPLWPEQPFVKQMGWVMPLHDEVRAEVLLSDLLSLEAPFHPNTEVAKIAEDVVGP